MPGAGQAALQRAAGSRRAQGGREAEHECCFVQSWWLWRTSIQSQAVWGQEAGAHMGLSSQTHPGLETSRREPQMNCRQLIPRQDLNSGSEQVSPALLDPANSPTLSTSSQARPHQDEPCGDRATLRAWGGHRCLQGLSALADYIPSEAASWMATPPVHTCWGPLGGLLRHVRGAVAWRETR